MTVEGHKPSVEVTLLEQSDRLRVELPNLLDEYVQRVTKVSPSRGEHSGIEVGYAYRIPDEPEFVMEFVFEQGMKVLKYYPVVERRRTDSRLAVARGIATPDGLWWPIRRSRNDDRLSRMSVRTTDKQKSIHLLKPNVAEVERIVEYDFTVPIGKQLDLGRGMIRGFSFIDSKYSSFIIAGIRPEELLERINIQQAIVSSLSEQLTRTAVLGEDETV